MRICLTRAVGHLLFFCALLAVPAIVHAQGTTDLIRGKVTGPDSVPLFGVRVSVMSLETQMVRASSTDSAGRYTVFFPNGGGDYIASYTMIGFHQVIRQVKRFNDEALLVADINMTAVPFMLQNVVVTAQLLPERGMGDLPDSTGIWALLTGAGLTLGDMGNLALMAAQAPGVNLVLDDDGNPTGVSVLGLGSAQNRVMVDGVLQNIENLPTEGMADARITTTTSDPSKGGFSGAAVSVNSKPGSWQVTRTLGLTVDEPNLQFSDPAAMQLGREYTNLQLSGETSGPVIKDRLFGRASFQVSRRTNDRATLLNTGAVGFSAIGASADSVGRLLTVANALGVPLSLPGIPEQQRQQNLTVMMRGDYTPAGTHALNATFNGSWRNQTASSSSPLVAPARGGETGNITASGQVNHSFYLPGGILSETKLARTYNNSTNSPYINLPDIRVRVRSVGEDDRTTVTNFQLGGNSAMPVVTRNRKWEFINGLSWASEDNAHRVKLGTELRYDHYAQSQSTNSLGTFNFNSLADFVDGRPSDFRRQLTTVNKGADLFTAAFSLGDQWRKTKDLNIQYGIRVEVDHYGVRPPYNPAVEDVFNVRNDNAPNGVHIIPRFGFTWSYGVAPQIAAFDGARRGPRATVKGTLGEYRNTPSNSLLQSAMGSSGLPNDISILSCVGTAAPTPDWHAYTLDNSTIPDQCADGTGGTVFAERQPSVLLFGRNYEPERSWRGDIGWSGTALKRFKLSVGALYSLNVAQTGNIDLNFRGTPRFTLPLEHDRPVFVNTTSISSRTGSVSAKDARVTQDFSKVTLRGSDLQSSSSQLTMSLAPAVVAPNAVRWTLGYVYSHSSEFKRGFGGTTNSSPFLRSWATGKGPDHQVNISLNYTLLGFKLGLAARVSSGVRYTPMIRGDVNGDGESNDRAMVFDPLTTADTALANGMATLLAGAPGAASRCLREQLGAIAASNSCTGPMSTSLNLSLSLDAMQFVLPGRTTMSMSFGNPMTGLDLLVSGKSEPRSWGQQNSNPDATLLYVRGFDPNTRSYRYEVNPAFGSSRASRASQSRPFQVTVKFSTDISPPLEKQKLKRDVASWRTGEASRPNESTLKRQYMQPFTSMFETILKQKDTLRLSTPQADTITMLTAEYVERLDSMWVPMARSMANPENQPNVNVVHQRMQTLRQISFQEMSRHAQAVRSILTEEQFIKLPQSFSIYFDERAMRKMR